MRQKYTTEILFSELAPILREALKKKGVEVPEDADIVCTGKGSPYFISREEMANAPKHSIHYVPDVQDGVVRVTWDEEV